MGRSMAGYTVNGRSFRTEADYRAALKDAALIDKIRKENDLSKAEQVNKVYTDMQSGKYRFLTMVGQDFDDEIYEMIQTYKKNPSANADAGNMKKTSGKTTKEAKKLVVEDDDFKKEVERQLKKRERGRKFIVVMSALVAFLCVAYLGMYYFYYDRSSADYEELAQLKDTRVFQRDPSDVIVHKTLEEEVELPDVLSTYATLYQKNQKLIGWIKILGTDIDYPVMQTKDNEYYLTYNYNQEYDKNGSIFMDCDCVAYPKSDNIILYGHNMKSGKMFGDLDLYSKESYGKAHSIIQFDTIYETGTYEVMYVFRSHIYNENEVTFKYYQFIDAMSEQEFDSNMNEMAQMSLYDTGVTAKYGDKLLTLSTCDSSQQDGRFVVVAKQIN